MTLSDIIKRATLHKAYEFLERDPGVNFPKLLEWLDKMDYGGSIAQLSVMKKIANGPSSNWRQLIDSLWTEVDGEVRKTIFTNVVINACVAKLGENRERYQCSIPWTVQMELSSSGGEELSFDVMDTIVEQGKELGICFYILTGRPEKRHEDLIALCNKHSDCEFLAVVEQGGVDAPFADEMLRVKNIIPVLFQGSDSSGKRLGEAMRILREKRLLFGILCICEKENAQAFTDEAYFDFLVAEGAKFAGFAAYMPVGRNGDSNRMLTPEQRVRLYQNIRAFRKTKPIFSIDFREDAQFVNGCIGGGRRYCRINASGDIEPCEQVRYSDSNIRDKSLLAAFCSPLFLAFQSKQPFCSNLFCSCPVMEVPGQLEDLAREQPLHSTDPDGDERIEDLCKKNKDFAAAWKPVAERLWEEEMAQKGEEGRTKIKKQEL